MLKNKINYGKFSNQKLDGDIVYQKRDDFISINITNKCPNNCPFCIRDIYKGWNENENLYLNKEPTIIQIEDNINSYIRQNKTNINNIKNVNICGYGEPLMRLYEIPKIVKIIHSIFNKNTEITLITSGWIYKMFPKKYVIDSLIKAQKNGLNKIKISLHSVNNEQFIKRFRPIFQNVKIDDSILFIKLCKSIGFQVIGCFFENMNSLDDINSFCNDLEINSEIKYLKK